MAAQINKLWEHRNPGICFSHLKTGVRWPMLSICHFGTKGIFILKTFVCNTICVFIYQYSVGTNFSHLYCWIWIKLFCFQFQERFSTEATSWREIEIEQSVQNFLASIIQVESLLPMFNKVCRLCKKDWIMPIQEMFPNQFSPWTSLCTCPSSSVPALPTLS